MEKIRKLIFILTINQFVSLQPCVCVQDFDTYDGNIFSECIMKISIIYKQQSFLNTCQENAAHGKEQEKPWVFFSFEYIFFFINRQFIGMDVPQGDQRAAEGNWSVIGVLWQFSIHSGIGCHCQEMSSSPHCKFDFLHSSSHPQNKPKSKASVRQFFALNTVNIKALYTV